MHILVFNAFYFYSAFLAVYILKHIIDIYIYTFIKCQPGNFFHNH